jgi:hypothetical protein
VILRILRQHDRKDRVARGRRVGSGGIIFSRPQVTLHRSCYLGEREPRRVVEQVE